MLYKTFLWLYGTPVGVLFMITTPSSNAFVAWIMCFYFSRFLWFLIYSDHSQKYIKILRFPNTSGEGISISVQMFLDYMLKDYLYLQYFWHLTSNNIFILHQHLLHCFSFKSSLKKKNLNIFPDCISLISISYQCWLYSFYCQYSCRKLRDDLFVLDFCFQRCATK